MKISMIVAKSKNNVIGINNTLPWKLSDDLKLFKETTSNKSILMGLNTFKSIGKALPNRKNIILTRKKDLTLKDCIVINDFEEIYNIESKEIVIIGGDSIYKQFLKEVNHKLYITEVHCSLNGDAYFPNINYKDFEMEEKKEYYKNDKNEYDFTFYTYKKRL